MDYKDLCQNIFGTADIGELKVIAERAEKAVRKPKVRKGFSNDDIWEIRRLHARGLPVGEIAKRFNSTRQVINGYVYPERAEEYVLRIELFRKGEACTMIEYDIMCQRVRMRSRAVPMWDKTTCILCNTDWMDLKTFLEKKGIPSPEGTLEELLKCIGCM